MYPFDQFNTSDKIHAEIDKVPLDALFGVFFLFLDEHNVVEELLQFLVGEIDAKSFETLSFFLLEFKFISRNVA